MGNLEPHSSMAITLGALRKLVMAFAGLACSMAALAGDSSHFEAKTRALLGGPSATSLIDYCGRMRGTQDGSWVPTETDLDALDTVLAPLLSADLKSEGATKFPAQYYRQYSAGMWEGQHVIYVNGFHEQYLQSLASASYPTNRWRTDPVIVNDGGPNYWCAIFVKDTGKFVTIKEKGRPNRTVAFHGYA